MHTQTLFDTLHNNYTHIHIHIHIHIHTHTHTHRTVCGVDEAVEVDLMSVTALASGNSGPTASWADSETVEASGTPPRETDAATAAGSCRGRSWTLKA